MPSNSQAKIDGDFFSWAELQVTLGLIKGPTFSTDDIAGLSFSDKIETGAVRGAGPKKRGTTVGIYDADAELTLYADAARNLLKAMQTVNPRVTLVRFTISALWEPLSGNGKILPAKLTGCRLKSRDFGDLSPKPDAAQVVFALDVTELEVDGVKLV